MNEIKGIIWDFGGVVTESPFEAFNRFEIENKIPKDFIRGINATNPNTNAWALFESSKITLEQFDEYFYQESSAKGHGVRGKDVVPLLSCSIRKKMLKRNQLSILAVFMVSHSEIHTLFAKIPRFF